MFASALHIARAVSSSDLISAPSARSTAAANASSGSGARPPETPPHPPYPVMSFGFRSGHRARDAAFNARCDLFWQMLDEPRALFARIEDFGEAAHHLGRGRGGRLDVVLDLLGRRRVD